MLPLATQLVREDAFPLRVRIHAGTCGLARVSDVLVDQMLAWDNALFRRDLGSACGSELRPAAKFCDECGASAAARPVEAAGTRKVVTIVFADLVGSTALHERLDAESARPFMEEYYRAMRGAVEASGGTVAWNGHGLVAAIRQFGTILDDGGPFENVFFGVILNGGDRIQRYEMFAEDAAERAVACFEELGAGIEVVDSR